MKNIFLEKSINEIIALIVSKKIDSNELLSLSKKIYKGDGKKYKVWNSFGIDKNYTDLGIVNNKLKGIPFGAKDIFNTISFPTEMGSKIWKNYQAGNNARVIDNLICSGGHLVGKTVTAEFAVHELNETLNPHDPKRTPGTSSSGSAVAVQIGNIPFALGSQTAGSIIRPASFCGVWGMKPSYGLVPRTGVLKTTDTLDTIGFLTSHAKNLKIILDIIRVKGPNYPYVYNNIDKKDFSHKKFKIGFLKTNLWDYTKKYIKEETLNFVEKLSKDKNILIQEIKWPKKFYDMHSVHSAIYSKSLSYYFNKEYKNSGNISKIMNQLIEEGKNISVNTFHAALHKQMQFQIEVNNIFKNFDVCITYSTASEAVMRGQREIDDTCLLWTLAGIPAVNAPLTYSPSGLPFGIQLISKKWNDYRILKFIDYLVDNDLLSSFILKKQI
jgi:Asp-tRNA(Asn)/Glu-tRNA(Gln) amidotransferase A subunit family amidase